jgi:lipopolysaccharide export system permease protein
VIFERSLIREFSLVALAVVAVLLALILTRLLILLLGKAAGGEVLAEAVIGLIAFGILTYLPLLLSIAAFVAVLLTLTRSFRDSEMTVWFTSGLSIAAWVKPVLRFALPIALVCAVLSLAISPWSQAQSREYQRLLESRDEVSAVTPGVFRESRQADRVFFVDKLSERDDVVNNVFVQSTHGGRLGVMVAQKGFIETVENGDRFVVLLNGRRYEGTPGTLDYRTVDFERYMLRIEPREAKKDVTPPAKSLSTLDLLADPTPHNIAELHWRVSLPFSVLLMALFAVPLSFVNPRTGKSWNLALAVLAYALYNNLLSIFQAWTAQGKVPTWVGLWPVHVAVIALLAFLLSRQMVSRRWFMLGR